MPAPIPPGHTRGQIMFIGNLVTAEAAATLLQSFWTEAGAYGARILVVNVAEDTHSDLAHTLFRQWEAAGVARINIATRAAGLDPAHLERVEDATAILITAPGALHLTRRLGGTALAQAIRRANARNKIVGGIGPAASALCQHMLVEPDGQAGANHPVHFAPGLGLINRTAVITTHAQTAETAIRSQLLAAVQCNPFLVGVGLTPDSALIVYQDSTVHTHGRAYILDGAEITDDTFLAPDAAPTMHRLSTGYAYNLDRHVLLPPAETDIPSAENHITSAF